jgi:hypothetical protein
LDIVRRFPIMLSSLLMSTFCSASPPTESGNHPVQDEKSYHPFSRLNSLLLGSEDPKSFAMVTPSLVLMILHLLDKLQLVPGVDSTGESNQVVNIENYHVSTKTDENRDYY